VTDPTHADRPTSPDLLSAGHLLTGPLFDEPVRVATVQAGGPNTWVVGVVGTHSERFRSVTLTVEDLACLTIIDSSRTYDGDGRLLRLGLQAYAESLATFDLTLRQTYYKMGFFNIGVGYDRYVRQTEGPVQLRLGRDGAEIAARVDRRANPNGTPRVMGGAQLTRWLQANFRPMDTVAVDLSSQDVMILDRK